MAVQMEPSVAESLLTNQATGGDTRRRPIALLVGKCFGDSEEWRNRFEKGIK